MWLCLLKALFSLLLLQVEARNNDNQSCDFLCDANSNHGHSVGSVYKYTSEIIVNNQETRSNKDKSDEYYVKFDTSCSFIMARGNEGYQMKFVFSDGAIKTVCVFDENTPLELANQMKSVASLIQIESNYKSEASFVPDISGHCKVTYEDDFKVRHKDLLDCVKPITTEQGFGLHPYQSFQSCFFMFEGDKISCSESVTIGNSEVFTISQKLSRELVSRTFSQQNTGYVLLDSLTMRFVENNGTYNVGLRDLMNDSCYLESPIDFSTLPSSLVKLVHGMRVSKTSELAGLYEVLESICPERSNLDTRRLFFDALMWCGADSCAKYASELILAGEIGAEQTAQWLTAVALVDNVSNLIVDSIAEVVETFSDENLFSKGMLAAGASVNKFCKEQTDCVKYSGVQKALTVLQKPLLNACQGNREEILVSLKGLGNAGQGDLALIKRCVTSPVEEIAAQAIHALRKFECTDERFEIVSGVLSTLTPAHLEAYQRAYIQLWQCPSLEAQSLAQWVFHQTEFENVKSLILEHAKNVMASVNPKYWEVKSLLHGIADGMFSLNTKFSRSRFSVMQLADPYPLYGAEMLQLMEPGSWIPRSIELGLEKNFAARFGIRLRSENIENVIMNAVFPVEEDYLTNDPAEESVTKKLGKDTVPKFTVDLQIDGNDLYTFDNTHIDDIVSGIKADIEEMQSMSAYEKIKAAFGYSNAGYLKYFNGEPADFQKAVVFARDMATFPTSTGKPIYVKHSLVALARVRASGSLSVLGFSGTLEPQTTIQQLFDIDFEQMKLKSKVELTTNFNSAMSASYSQASGIMELQVEKMVTDNVRDLIKFESSMIVDGAEYFAVPTPEEFYYSPAWDVRLYTINEGGVPGPFRNAKLAVSYAHNSSDPMIFRTQYDDTNGILASLTVKGSEEGKYEAFINYRESSNHLTISMDRGPTQLKLDGIISKKKFTGSLLNKNVLPLYDKMDLVIEDAATDKENKQNIIRPTVVIVVGNQEYIIKNMINNTPTRMLHELEMQLGMMGTYFIKQEVGLSFPQVLVEAHLGMRPQVSFESEPLMWLRVGVDQIQTAKEAGFKAVAMYKQDLVTGVKANFVVEPRGGAIELKTENVFAMMGTNDELSFKARAKWVTRRNKIKYQFDVEELAIPNMLYMKKKGKFFVESDITTKVNIKSPNAISGKQKYMHVQIDLPIEYGDAPDAENRSKHSIRIDVQNSISTNTDKGIFLLKVREFTPVKSFKGFAIESTFMLLPHNAKGAVLAKYNGQTYDIRTGYEKKGNTRTFDVNAGLDGQKYALLTELQITDKFGVLLAVKPVIGDKQYPAEIKYSDKSSNKLDLSLEVSLTGILQTGGVGQPDAVTLSLNLLEDKSNIFTVNGDLFAQNLIHSAGTTAIYSGEMIVANADAQTGVSISLSNESNEVLAAEIMKKKEGSKTDGTVRGRVGHEALSFHHEGNTLVMGGKWSHEGTLTIKQELSILGGMPPKSIFKGKFLGQGDKMHSELEFVPGEGYYARAKLNLNFLKLSGDLQLTQNLMRDGGFESIVFRTEIDRKKGSLSLVGMRDGKQGQFRAKAGVLSNGIQFVFNLKDPVLEAYIPTKTRSKFIFGLERGYKVGFEHDHVAKKPMNNGSIKIHASLDKSNIQLESFVDIKPVKAKHVFQIHISDFSTLENPAKILVKQQTSDKSTDFIFTILMSSDSQSEFQLKQNLNCGGKEINTNFMYQNKGVHYTFTVETTNKWNTDVFPHKLRVVEEIEGKGPKGLSITSLLEMKFKPKDSVQNCQLIVDAVPGKDGANFKITWTTTLKTVVEQMKTFEHLVAEGKASWKLPSPSAKFTLKAVSSNESAEIEFTSKLISLFNFRFKLYTDQSFNMFPLTDVYAIELINENFIASHRGQSLTKLIFTSDDVYTPEVETFTTELLMDTDYQFDNSVIKILNRVPSKLNMDLNISEMFGELAFKNMHFGYEIMPREMIGKLNLLVDKRTADFDIHIYGNTRAQIKYAHANFDGPLGTCTLNQDITLNDNGIRISNQGISIPIFDIEDKVEFKLPAAEIDIKPVVNFRMENTDRLFAIKLSWKTDTNEREKLFNIMFHSEDDTAELNVELFDYLNRNFDLPSMTVGMLAIAKTAADPFMVGIIHPLVMPGRGRQSRNRYGGEFTFTMFNFFPDDVEFLVTNTYETKQRNFKFNSLTSIDCQHCNVPLVSHDLLIEWNAVDTEVRNRWDLNIEDVMNFATSFTVDAGLTSFEIKGDPLFELVLDSENLQRSTGIENIKVELDFDAFDSDDAFTLEMNNFDLEINRQQYHFAISKGLIEVSKDKRLHTSCKIEHNIDELSNLNILQRSEFDFTFHIINTANWNFETEMTLRGASRKRESLRILHQLNGSGVFNKINGQTWLRSGVVKFTADSSILARQIKINLKKVGFKEQGGRFTEFVSDFDAAKDRDHLVVLIRQKLLGNYKTEASINYMDDVVIEIINDWKPTGTKLLLDVIAHGSTYQSGLDCFWELSNGFYTLDCVYTNNIQAITGIADKVIVNGSLREDFKTFKLLGEVGRSGTLKVNYDVDFSDNLGEFGVIIPGLTAHSLSVRTSTTDMGYILQSEAPGYRIASDASAKCEVRNSAEITCILHSHKAATVGKYQMHFNADTELAYKFTREAGDFMFNFECDGDDDGYGGAYNIKIQSEMNYKPKDKGAFLFTWSMPSLYAGKYIKIGGMAKLRTAQKDLRKGSVTFHFDDYEPMRVEYKDLFTEETFTVGMHMSLGAIMEHVEKYCQSIFDYGIPRNSFDWQVDVDKVASKYSVSISPDRRLHQVNVSFNREGINLIFTQPHQISYIPTEFSSHCDYIGRDQNVNCYIKMLLNNIEREVNLNIGIPDNNFELDFALQLDPVSVPIQFTFRVVSGDPSSVVFMTISCENLNFESTNQYSRKQNLYSVQSSNTLTQDQVTEEYNFAANLNTATNIAEITVKTPSMARQDVLRIDFNKAAQSLTNLLSETGISTSSGTLMPRIGREENENELIFYVGVGRSESEFTDIALKIYKDFHHETDDVPASMEGGLKFIARQSEKVNGEGKTNAVDLTGVHLKIQDQEYVQLRLYIHPAYGEVMQVDLNEIENSIHEAIDENIKMVKFFLKGLMKSAMIQEDSSLFSSYYRMLWEFEQKQAKHLKNNAHHVVKTIMMTIRSTNPTIASQGGKFTIADIPHGYIQEAVMDVLPMYTAAVDRVVALENRVLVNVGEYGALRSALAVAVLTKENEIIITLPLPLSAQDPTNFDIRKAIMDSPVVQKLLKYVNTQTIIDFWYQIRAALAKPDAPILETVASIVNGRHIITFDGMTYSLDGATTCRILLAKDFGRTGSTIHLVNGQIKSRLAPNSGFDIVQKGPIVTIKAAARLYGNVAGALGTISGEKGDDMLNPSSESDPSSALRGFNQSCSGVQPMEPCKKHSSTWKKSEKSRLPCSPVVDPTPYETFTALEECKTKTDLCAIYNLYLMRCKREGAFFAAKCS